MSDNVSEWGSSASRYQRARAAGRDQVRAAVLDTAGRLLAAEGAGALTMRRVAAEVGCSTTVLYTLFGAKDGLAEALYREGFERFGRRLDQLPPSADPLTHLAALGEVYRASALADPQYYRVMFAGAIPGFTPSPEALSAADSAFAVMVETVAACMDSGAFVRADPLEVATVLWATSHGVVSLELSGHLPGDAAERCYRAATTAATAWFTTEAARARG